MTTKLRHAITAYAENISDTAGRYASYADTAILVVSLLVIAALLPEVWEALQIGVLAWSR